MSDMSFKQAKELVEKIELTELSLKKTVDDIDASSKSFNEALRQQRIIMDLIPRANFKMGLLKLLIAVQVGFIAGIFVGIYIL
ncbi:hypothetical protein CRV04_06875 [Candidatus Marinarcus aquaticus]|uniref:Uncharacterized protein n=2 Tax=Candidatus Marinarcus aquaticus TaxID=2044504 RepID=A0A4Q0XPK5_9BACT|nr:hypothetical protein CRV04_06875 [Candidatus Marinarcus aquaticus]